MIGNTSSSIAGCCHSFSADGRCITLLTVLMSNACVYDCKYCVNRSSTDKRRAAFTPRELAELTIGCLLYTSRPYHWGNQSIVGILERQEYTGCTCNFKTYSKSYKLKKRSPRCV